VLRVLSEFFVPFSCLSFNLLEELNKNSFICPFIIFAKLAFNSQIILIINIHTTVQKITIKVKER
jgi:hypothetical protein